MRRMHSARLYRSSFKQLLSARVCVTEERVENRSPLLNFKAQRERALRRVFRMRWKHRKLLERVRGS